MTQTVRAPKIRAQRSIDAEKEFLEIIRAKRATPRYTTWQGNQKPHEIVCSAGHVSTPTPANVRRGQGICRICAGQDPVTTERKFVLSLIARGDTPIYGKYEGANTAHLVRCTKGHEYRVSPAKVRSRGDGCHECQIEDTRTRAKGHCARCGENRMVGEAGLCTSCVTQTWRERYPDHYKALNKANNDKAQANGLRYKRHGITEDIYKQILESQSHKCAICGSEAPSGQHGEWHIDHDHNHCKGPHGCAKCVRGILCMHCNQMLGHARDSVEVLRRAIKYLGSDSNQ